MELRGVTISLLHAIGKIAKERDSQKSWSIGRISNEVLGTHELLHPAICRWRKEDGRPVSPEETLTYGGRCSLVDLLKKRYLSDKAHPQLGLTYSQAVGEAATAFVSFAYVSDYFELLSCLDKYLASNQLDENKTFFWFDPCVNDQWSASLKSFDWWSNTFRTAVQNIGETVVIFTPWYAPQYLTRAWCLLEFSFSKNIHIMLSEQQHNELISAIIENFPSIERALCDVDFAKSQCFVPEDQNAIFNVVKSLPNGFIGLNQLVGTRMRNWLTKTIDIEVEKYYHLHSGSSTTSFDTVKEVEREPVSKEKMYETILERNDQRMVILLSNAAILFRTLGKLEEAKVLLKLLIEDLEIKLTKANKNENEKEKKEEEKEESNNTATAGTNDPNTINQKEQNNQTNHMKFEIINNILLLKKNLANIYSLQGEENHSLTLHLQILDGYKAIYGNSQNQNEIFHQMGNIGSCYYDLKQYSNAEKYLQEGLHGFLNTNCPIEKISFICNKLAAVYLNQKKINEAEEMLQRVLPLDQLEKEEEGEGEGNNDEHESTFSSTKPIELMQLSLISTLSSIYEQKSNFMKAKKLIKFVLIQREKILGSDHPATLSTLFDYSKILGQLGEYQEQFHSASRVVVKAAAILGRNHPYTLGIVDSLARCSTLLEDYLHAIEYFSWLIEGSIGIHGLLHHLTIEAKINLAISYKMNGNLEEAMMKYQEIISSSFDGRDLDEHFILLKERCEEDIKIIQLNLNSIEIMEMKKKKDEDTVYLSSHPEHPVCRREIKRYGCDICEKEGFIMAYSCVECNYDVHALCAVQMIGKET